MDTDPTDKAMVATWPDYQKRRIGIRFPGVPARFLTPEKARSVADSIEDNCLDDLMDPTLETFDLVHDLRRHADDIEDK